MALKTWMILVQAQESLHAICLTGIYHERNTTALKSSKQGKDSFNLGDIAQPSKPTGKQTPINDLSIRQAIKSVISVLSLSKCMLRQVIIIYQIAPPVFELSYGAGVKSKPLVKLQKL
jgi:hypothetical protein